MLIVGPNSTAPNPTPPGEFSVTFNTSSGASSTFFGSAANAPTVKFVGTDGDDLLIATCTGCGGGNTGMSLENANGQNGGTDTSIEGVNVSVPNSTFGDFIVDVFGAFSGSSITLSGDATSGAFSKTFANVNVGSHNFFQITTSAGDAIQDLQISGRFFALRDMDISGVSAVSPVVPEPSSLLLLLGGLAPLARRLKRH